MIMFLAEIVVNLLDGNLIEINNNNDKRPYLKFRLLLEKIYNAGMGKNKKKKTTTLNITLSQQRAVFSSPKGLQLVKLLFNIVKNRQFTR